MALWQQKFDSPYLNNTANIIYTCEYMTQIHA